MSSADLQNGPLHAGAELFPLVLDEAAPDRGQVRLYQGHRLTLLIGLTDQDTLTYNTQVKVRDKIAQVYGSRP